jgi:hypothetical protein
MIGRLHTTVCGGRPEALRDLRWAGAVDFAGEDVDQGFLRGVGVGAEGEHVCYTADRFACV